MSSLPHTDISKESLVDILRLIRSDNVGPVTFFQMVGYYGSVANAIAAIPELAKRGGRKRPIKLSDIEKVEQEIEDTLSYGAKFVIYGSDDYPALLSQIHDAPPVLTFMGDANIWQMDSVGIVGSRNASANGCRWTHNMAKELGEAGFVVTSGLARGIDTFAHQGALDIGTIAVIAGGIDVVYPAENQKLYEQLQEHGAIITEAPFGTSPQARHFPRRNRIISGISKGVLVVEASRKSGSLLTANFALEQGRDVFAVPGSPMDPRCGGTNYLLKEGAILTESINDIINNISQHIAVAKEPAQRRLFEDEESFDVEIIAKDEYNKPELHLIENTRELVASKLGMSLISPDELADQMNVPVENILSILLEMEVCGDLQRHAGGKVSAIYS